MQADDRLARLLAIALLTACFGGCSITEREMGRPLPGGDNFLHPGLGSIADVLREFGPPHRISALDGGYVMAWEHWRITERELGVSLRAFGLDFLSADWGAARLRGDFLLVFLDDAHRVRGVSFDRWDSHAGGGQGIQPLGSVVPLVDVDDLTDPLPQHLWGAFALRRLPAGLNAASDPASGASGLEQRGTPRGAGQRSLESR